jgi:hypothetical protein
MSNSGSPPAKPGVYLTAIRNRLSMRIGRAETGFAMAKKKKNL